MSNDLPPLAADYTAADLAKAFRRSERWIKDRIKRDGIEHTRRGNKITFTPDQAEAFRKLDAVVPLAQPVTTGRAK